MTLTAERVAPAEQVGLSTRRLERISALFESFIDRGVIAGAVTLIARNGQIAHLAAHGHMDIADGRRMTTDAIFRLASMTKPVISAAVLMLLEEGKVLLTEPVSTYLPTFKNLQVAVPNPPSLPYVETQLAPGGFHLVPANREITLRDLLTHTSGLGSATVGPAVAAMAALPARQPAHTLKDIVPRMAEVPLSFQPGTCWEYSPTFAFDTLGRVVEIVSGLALDDFLRQRLFEPLGMSDTSFALPAEKLSRVATVYERSDKGLRPGTPTDVLGLSTNPNNRYFSGGGGLAGTARDYNRFGVMLANGGELDGERILSRKTVELMASNHIGQLPFDRPVSDLRGYRFGLGVRVLDDRAEACTLASRGTFGWAGAYNTNSWIDPTEDMVGILLTQRMRDVSDKALPSLWPRFQSTAYQAIED